MIWCGDGKLRTLQRAVWWAEHGDPEDRNLCVYRNCADRGCFNPGHMYLGRRGTHYYTQAAFLRDVARPRR